MACDCGGAPYEAWRDLDHTVTSLGWGYLGLIAFLAVLVWTLVSKGIITWADLFTKAPAE